MNDDQRNAAAAALVGDEASVRLHLAITDFCSTLRELATDESDRATIQDAIDVVTITGEFSPLP